MQYNEYQTCRRQYQEIGRDLLLSRKHACLYFEPGKGKAIENNRLIPMPNGYKTMGELQIGDIIFSGDGEETKVLAVYPQGLKPCYKVTFADGRETIASADHLWTVRKTEGRKNDTGYLYTTEQLKNNFKRKNGPSYMYLELRNVEHTGRSLDDLYLIGLFIGNGCCTERYLAYSSGNDYLPKEIAYRLGYECKNNPVNYTYYFYDNGKKVEASWDLPEWLLGKKSTEKELPREYMSLNLQDKIELLAGLIDTDGCIVSDDKRCRIMYSTSSEVLAKQVTTLFRSLGYRCTNNMTSREDGWTISPAIPKNDISLFTKNPKHLSRIGGNNLDSRYMDRLYFKSFEYVGEMDCTCITVDNEKKLFMVDDFIQTHNTYPAIDAMREVDRLKGGKAKVLIISSCDAIRKMWNVEIVPQQILPKDTYLVTDRTAIGNISEVLLATKWDIVLVDECHIVKAHNSKIHKLVYKLCRNVEYAWGLSGTPRGNRDIDIWCQFHALHIAGNGKLSYTSWTRIHCNFETGYGAYGQFQTPTTIKDQYLPLWNSTIEENCLFVDYDEDDDMPDLNVTVVDIPYEKTQTYKQAHEGIIKIDEFATTTTKMVAIMKAHQVCNGYVYLPDKVIYRLHRNKKLDYLNDLEKCVIVYKYTADYDDLMAHFENNVTNDVDKFKTGKYKILLLQCGMCQSFNLQEHCNTIIFYTMDYSFIKYKQMIHRLWRLGQKLPTKIIVLQHKDTVEKQIWTAVTTKQKMHDLYMSIKRC